VKKLILGKLFWPIMILLFIGAEVCFTLDEPCAIAICRGIEVLCMFAAMFIFVKSVENHCG
jgi:hypothetical protein